MKDGFDSQEEREDFADAEASSTDFLSDELDFDEESDEEVADVGSEGSYVCEHCGEQIVIPLDVAAGRQQQYVEDCPVCCSPNVIFVEVDGPDVRVWATPE